MRCSHIPNYCKIELKNDGEYVFNMDQATLEENWYLSIIDDQFNPKILDEECVIETIEEMEKILFMIALSN